MTAALVALLADSRPPAERWQATPLVPAGPTQPTLDLRPPSAPVVLLPADDLAEHTVPGLPDAQAWSVALATRLLEVLTGHRAVGQLSRWLSEDVLTGLAEQLPRVRVPGAARQPVRLQSVRLQYPRTGAVEVSVHARPGRASLACAFRLEAQPSRWLCTALDLGPGGRPGDPDPT
ncbi:Rv3235 family protein [uncultured Friedmanniella sp.]|uniref:Rv3235 family protein n=1 Tax=uncultured Friedmanniella sp. TaxID=335381 RepID=UPI0035CAE089